MESKKDYPEVENLVRDSFWNVYRPGAYEHYIVHNLRNDESFIPSLAYVIEDDGCIKGHINYSKGFIDYGTEKVDAVVLGPVCIDRNSQNQGLGSKLIQYTLEIAQNKNIPFVFVIGDENYYHRFGFENASKFNLFLEHTDTDEENLFFMIKIFEADKLKDARGIFHNPDVFNVNQKDVDDFDEKFEFREKIVLKGQLEEL